MSSERSCPQCGSPVASTGRFCPNCGNRLSEPPQIPLPSETPPAPSSSIASAQTGRWRWIIMAVALLALVVIGSRAFLIQLFRSPEAAPPSVATVLTPSPARTTTFVLQKASATAIGGIIGQPTPLGAAALAQIAQAQTAQALTEIAPTQTAAALDAEVSTLFAHARQVFYDEFVDNRNAWFTGEFQEIELDLIEDGVFKVLWTGRGTSYELYELSSFTDFMSEVDCQIFRGGENGSCGLIFAEQRKVGFYKFEFFIDYYRLSAITTEGEPVVLAEGDPRRLARISEQNRLRVIRQGDRIRLFVNGALAADLRDTTFGAGRVGVSTACYREEGGVEVHFDNFGIWSLPTGS
jgi:hypothetical protein